MIQTFRQILIVDDEEDFADNLKTYLQRKGYGVVVAHSGGEAIAAAAVGAPELVIADFSMDGMNGVETINVLRRRLGPVGCILMSGHLADDVLQLVHRSGIRHVLSKPFSLADLHRLLDLPYDELRLGDEAPQLPSDAPARRGRPDRRQGVCRLAFPFLLADGTWLFAERRRFDRRTSPVPVGA